jgi:protein-export membrane protein SecD
MLQNLKVRVALIVGLALLSGFALFMSYQQRQSIVALGLDLKGGVYLGLEIDESQRALTAEQRADAIDRALTVVRLRVDELGLTEPVVQKVGEDRMIVQLAGVTNTTAAKDVIQRAAFLQFQIVRPEGFAGALPRMERAIVAAFPEERAAPRRAPTAGVFQQPETDTAEVTASPLGSKIVSAGPQGQFMVAAEDTAVISRYLALPAVQQALPRGTELLWGVLSAEEQRGLRSLWLVERQPLITGEYLENAVAARDPQFNRPIVSFELSRRGGRIFERETGRNVGNQMAIVLDNQVYTAPVIRSQIGRRGQIELGQASLDEAAELALVLRAGALPAPLRIIEERTVGPSLGQDSVDRGFTAGMIGIGLVILLMIAYYRMAGVLAVSALTLYVLFVLGTLAGLNAVLTFPGIAGLILSIGMAVDANVLIFERIREELAIGRSVRPAVAEGFQNALSAIVDSNITTLLTAGILYYVGTGPIKGFAVTLGIGIVLSMFTAIFVTRTFFNLYLERRSPAAQGLSI